MLNRSGEFSEIGGSVMPIIRIRGRETNPIPIEGDNPAWLDTEDHLLRSEDFVSAHERPDGVIADFGGRGVFLLARGEISKLHRTLMSAGE